MSSSPTISKPRRRILDYLEEHPIASPKQIAEDLDKTGGSVRKLLNDMREDGQVARPIHGVYALPRTQRILEEKVGGQSDLFEEFIEAEENPTDEARENPHPSDMTLRARSGSRPEEGGRSNIGFRARLARGIERLASWVHPKKG